MPGSPSCVPASGQRARPEPSSTGSTRSAPVSRQPPRRAAVWTSSGAASTRVHGGLADALATGGGIDRLDGGVAIASGSADCGNVCKTVLGQVAGGLSNPASGHHGCEGRAREGLRRSGAAQGQLGDAAVGLVRVECGLSNTTLKGYCDPTMPGLLEGLDLVDTGVSTLVDGVVAKVQGGIGGPKDTAKSRTLRGGVNDLQDGVDLLGLGGVDLLDAIDQSRSARTRFTAERRRSRPAGQGPRSGAAKLANGSSDLATVGRKLDAGSARSRTVRGSSMTVLPGSRTVPVSCPTASPTRPAAPASWPRVFTDAAAGARSSGTGPSACPTRGRRSSSRPARRRRRTTARSTPSSRSAPGAPRPRAWPTAPLRVRSARRRTPTSSRVSTERAPPTPDARPLRRASSASRVAPCCSRRRFL